MHRFILILLLFPSIAAATKPNLLLITIDTLRADRLGAYGRKEARTPHLDALAAKSMLFEQAVCQAPLTLPSHASLLTGRYPHHHGVRDNAGRMSSNEITLAEILKQQGYHTYAAVGGFPLDHRFGLDQGFDVYNDELPRRRNRPLDFGSERTADAVVEAVTRFKPIPPYFLWVHFYDPHAPYLNGGYEGEIAFVDKQVGRLLKLLPLQNTLIAVAGDHGEGLGEHDEWTHRIFIYDSTMLVPFWISGPGVAPSRIKEQVRLIDFAPTILSLMKISNNTRMDGVVLPAGANEPSVIESLFPQLQLGWSPLIGVRAGGWKYIDAPRAELYELRNDPSESRNVIAQRSDMAKKLRALLPARSPVAAPSELDPETAERLAALGYVGSAATPAGTGADPKDRIGVWNEIEKAVDLKESQAVVASEALEKARRIDPANPMLLNILAEKYAELQQWKRAEAILAELLKRDARNVLALARMARVQQRMGNPAEARSIAEKLLASESPGVEPHLILAQACLALNDVSCAERNLSDALEIDPRDLDSRNDLGNLYLQQGKNQAALAEFNRVLAGDPKNLQALNGAATHAYLEKRYEDCERLLGKALGIQPADTQTRMNLALLYSQTGRNTRAVEIYKQILSEAGTKADWKAEAAARLKALQP